MKKILWLFIFSLFFTQSSFAASIDGDIVPLIKPSVCEKSVATGGLGGSCNEPWCDDGDYACLWIETNGCTDSTEKPLGYCNYDDNLGEVTVCCVDKGLDQQTIDSVLTNKNNLTGNYYTEEACNNVPGGKCETEDDVWKSTVGRSSCDEGYTYIGVCKASTDNYYCCTNDAEYLESVGGQADVVDTEYGDYQLLEQIPGSSNTSGELQPYLESIYKAGFVLIVLGAIFMIGFGGFTYMASAGNTSMIKKGKGMITDAIIGLVVALCIWLILNIINPDLVNLSIDPLPELTFDPGNSGADAAEENSSSQGGTFAAKTYSGGNLFTDAQSRQYLSENSVSVNKSDCSSPGQTDCTSLGEFPQIMAGTAAGIRRACNCEVVITGGTEAGHSTHGKGRAAMDMRRTSDLDSLFSRQPKVGSSRGNPIYQFGRVKVWFEDSQHYHIWEPAN